MSRRPAPHHWARGFAFLLASLFASASGAHDLWLLSGQYRLEPLEATRVFINSGDAFPEALSLLGEHRVTGLDVHTLGERHPVTEFRVEGNSLTFEIRPTAPGSLVVALATRTRRVRLKAADFMDYVDANGLESIAELVVDLGEEKQAQVERYAKWAKAIIDVGEPVEEEREPAWSQAVGHTLELVPLDNPNAVSPGGLLRVRAEYEGEPLAGARLNGGKAGGPGGEIVMRTDSDGVATVTIGSAGRWFLRTIHMIRLDSDPEIRWESFWATMTFEVRAGDNESEP